MLTGRLDTRSPEEVVRRSLHRNHQGLKIGKNKFHVVEHCSDLHDLHCSQPYFGVYD